MLLSMPTRILVVDDEPSVRDLLAYNLRKARYDVLLAADGRSALRLARDEKPDLIVLDLMLPQVDGLDVCRELRREGSVPIIMLTALGEETDRVVGLEVGADDYLTKPFDSDELLARIRASLRRAGGVPTPPINVGGISYDVSLRDVAIHGKSVVLHGRELMLLEILLRNCGRMVPRATIMEEIYGFDDDVQASVLNSLIMRLRRRLEDQQAGVKIHMARGVGYMLTKVDQ